MSLITAIILGFVEGITEFLPISSTFHLILASRFLNLNQSDFVKLFEVFIQSGAIVAVILVYFKEIIASRRLLKSLIVSFVPTAIVGFTMYGVIKNVFFDSLYLGIIFFILIGLIFILVEILIKNKILKNDKGLDNLTFRNAIFIGIFQSFAIVPGVSRAGAVILGMILLGFRRDISAKYSFMLAIPTILSASLFDLYKMKHVLTSGSGAIGALLIGAGVSFICAYFVMRWFIRFLEKKSLVIFGLYRVVVGIILMLTFGMSL